MKTALVILLMLLPGFGWSQDSPENPPGRSGVNSTSADPILPHVKKIVAECNSKVLIIVMSENVRCYSLSANGSEFTVAPLVGTSVLSTSANSCVFGTEIDTVWITLSNPLTPGNYSVTVNTGTDGNTLVDDNGREIPPGETSGFSISPPIPTPLDSLTPVTCSPAVLQLVLPDRISCGTIAADGSDFKISGTPAVAVTKAEGDCVDGFTRTIYLTLSTPLVHAGNYQITLKQGSDGTTIINECGTETPAGANISFTTKESVSAAFTYDIVYGCIQDTILFHYPLNGADAWKWYMDSSFLSDALAPAVVAPVSGPRNVQHIVSNAICRDTATAVINLDNFLKAGFTAPAASCPKDLVSFTDASIGNIKSWNWNFGDGSFSSLENPPAHVFPDTRTQNSYPVSLVVQNDMGCYDTATAVILKMQSCSINVPTGFTPNGDGKNDYLYPLNAFRTTDLDFRVYNRNGQLLFETRDPTRKWDGTINGKMQPPGTYVWTLQYTDGVTAKKMFLSGASVLIR